MFAKKHKGGFFDISLIITGTAPPPTSCCFIQLVTGPNVAEPCSSGVGLRRGVGEV
jgi:hypothetical protein